MPRKANPGREVKGGMGQSLINKRKNAHYKKQASTQYAGVHVSDSSIDGNAGRFVSITDRHELDEFLCDALTKETEFEVQHSSTVILTSQAIIKPKGDHKLFEYETIPIPRRPHWTKDMLHEELDRAEREAFMTWRKQLAMMEETVSDDHQLTPFEKNLEVWKQLWRVLERSDIVVQILDARNPLLFRSKDMEAYVKELDTNKMCLLVINKADYLTPQARRMWSSYFKANKIDFVFWSAALEQARLDDLDRKRRRKEERGNYHGHNIDDDEDQTQIESDEEEDQADEPIEQSLPSASSTTSKRQTNDDDDEEDSGKDLHASSLWKENQDGSLEPVSLEQLSLEQNHGPSTSSSTTHPLNSSLPTDEAAMLALSSTPSILTRDDLFEYIIAKFINSSPENKKYYEEGNRITVGMTGYPNVGKSSTINVLAGAKKVRVGATPGKTKHFQTINATEQLTLCDCPGLVFPTFLSSRAELVCNGIMPIDQIIGVQGYLAPVHLVCEKVSRSQIQQTYSLIFPLYKEIGAEEFLDAYARMRSFYKDHGRPDDAHAARILLKDFVSGKLLYCHPPPNLSHEQRQHFYKSFHLKGKCMINENLFTSPEELKKQHERILAASIEGLGATEQAAEEAGIVGQRQVRPMTEKKGTKAPAATSSVKAVEEDDEDDEDEDDEIDETKDSFPDRPTHTKVNQAVFDASLRDDLGSAVLPTNPHSKRDAKLAEQGLNPDGTPMTKKQIQRLNQRPKHKTGKAFKLRKTAVSMDEVGMKTSGKSADSAARLYNKSLLNNGLAVFQ